MKVISILIIPLLFMFFASCEEDPMPPREYYNIDRIYSINLDESNLKLITTGSDFSLLSNNKIIYINAYKLNLCKSDGTNNIILTQGNPQVYSYQIFFNETKVLLNTEYLMNIDGSGLTSLNIVDSFKNNYKRIYEVAISPNEEKISYANILGLYIINSDGSNLFDLKDTTGQISYGSINFTSDGNKIAYKADIQNGIAIDLRLYDIKRKQDTSLFYNDDGNKVIAYRTSKWNTLLFSNGDGINLENLNNYTHTFLYSGGDPYFSNDSTKITFMNYGFTAICVMDLKENSIKIINVNLPNNYISHPILSLDGKHVFFQADTSWSVLVKSNNNIVY